MDKIAIFFFSGTGNTYFVSKMVTDVFRKTNKCDLYSVEKHLFDASKIIREYELIGLAYPIYGSSVPAMIKEFINQLENSSKLAFTFCTQMMFSGDGAAYGARLLEEKGFIVNWQEHFDMPNNITDIRFLTNKRKPRYQKIQNRIEKKANLFVIRILSGRKHKKGSNFISLLMGLSQRIAFEKIEEKASKSALKIKEDKCILCNICVENCPVQNLENVNGLILTKGNCTLCYRCINHCPEQAIYMISKKGVKNPYRGPVDHFKIKSVMTDDILEIKKEH